MLVRDVAYIAACRPAGMGSSVTGMFRLTLGAADEQIGQCEGAGDNSYRGSAVEALERLAADPWALDFSTCPNSVSSRHAQ